MRACEVGKTNSMPNRLVSRERHGSEDGQVRKKEKNREWILPPRRIDWEPIGQLIDRISTMKALAKLASTLTVVALLSSPGLGWADSHKADKAKAAKPYPLDNCLISGEKLDLTSSKLCTITHQGQELKFCCKRCAGKFQKDPAKYMSKVKAAAKKVKPYPLKTCIVSGEALGEMGKPYVLVRQGQEVKFCCKGCVKDFAKDEAGFLKKLAKAK
ncbi:YHS domain-containing protein [Candidatus Parcubacteria bacterium]|nr:MAG: YHS domain-containing protein [Candidatus Parcubacteria bacterium]